MLSIYSEKSKKCRDQEAFAVRSLMEKRRDWMETVHLFSEADHKEQIESVRDLINQFSLIRYGSRVSRIIFMFRNHGLFVGNRLEQLTTHEFCFSQLCAAQRDWQHKERKPFRISE